MSFQICLLVTDDPDDHQAFSEAVSDISDRFIVLIVIDSQKALDLLTAKKLLPDYIFLDLSMHGVQINSFLQTFKSDSDLAQVPMMIYGEEGFEEIEGREHLQFFHKEYEYSALKKFLKSFIK